MSLAEILQLSSIVGAALMAGTFFTFSTFVMRALARIPAAEGIRAMQAINITVINPLFMLAFMGTALISVAEIIRLFVQEDAFSTLSLLAALCYLIATFASTIVGNVPMNERLAKLDADDPASAEYWHIYLRVWTRWNHLRTVAPTVSVILWSLI